MNNKDLGLLILRLTLGILMLFHGISKISHGVEGIESMLMNKGIPAFLAYGVYLGEVLAPLLLIIGYRTRIAALIFAINMLVIIFIAHPSDILSLTNNGAWTLELPGLFLFGNIALFFTGGGKYALSFSNKWD